MTADGAAASKGDPLLPLQWAELEPLLDQLLDAAPEKRAALLEVLSAGDAARREALIAMLHACDAALPLLDRPAEERFDQLLSPAAEITLPDVLGERYRIARELGRGGMARVYLAHDLKHGRDVAVKVIRPELAASLGRERFLREIGIAARLRHPNIVPLYDSGDVQGILYFVMPYESGQSLRERLDRSKPLPVVEYVSVLRDVARALAYAHAQGVVHRDVKPDNVMLSGGAAVVTDFGIAKAVSLAQGPGNTTTLTQSGSGIGTPTYMAPEQAIGDPATDSRADLYAFGCLAYELISGAPPFHGMTNHQLVAAHVSTPPVPLTTVQPDVPERVATLVMQCLAKDPVDRPQTAGALLAVLDATGDVAVRAVPNAVAQPPQRDRSRTAVAALGLVVVAGAAYALWPRSPVESGATPAVLTVAVLPMESIGGDSLQRELADGLSDEVSTALVHEPGMSVMSRKGAGNYRGKSDLDYEKVGKELGARYLVTGQLRVFDGKSIVSATLHDAADGSIPWKESYTQQQANLGALRDSIVHGIAELLRARNGVAVSARAPVTRTVNPEAYRLYILGQRALERRGQSIQASVDNFERAVAVDTNYAEAFAGLSLARALSPYFSNISTDSVAPAVRLAAARALRLDSTQAPAHVALGLVHQHAYHWDSAATEFQVALRLRSPGDVEPLIQYGRHLLFRGRPREALKPLLLARKTEPASALVSSWVSYAFFLDGKADSAFVESERAYQSDTNNITTLTHGSLIRLAAGKRAEARQFAMRVTPLNTVGLYVLSALGDTALVSARLRVAATMAPNYWLLESARGYAALGRGDTASALTAFERATDRHEFWPSWEPVNDPLYAGVWGAARFRTVLQRVGLGDVRPLTVTR
jgi:serine/threonine-protein kinase